jgi:hypothetical protein
MEERNAVPYAVGSEAEQAVYRQVLDHSAERGHPNGLQEAGPCPRCGDRLKYIVRHPRLGFVVWCDRVGCVAVAQYAGADKD